MLGQAREDWKSALGAGKDQGYSERLLTIREFQPFHLTLIAEALRCFEDPDADIFDDPSGKACFSKGVPIGYKQPLPRTPAVFEEKTKWRAYDMSEGQDDMLNYKSVVGVEHILEHQFREEEALGMMYEVDELAYRQQVDPSRLKIAAQGAIEKSDSSFRVVHDGTHGVMVNNHIRPQDQLRMPGAGDARAIMQADKDTQEVVFTLVADVSKAHRRVLIRPEDWSLQCCRLRSGKLWVNRVGTFGLGSAAYWWGRLAAGIGRLVLYVLGQAPIWQLLYADDLRWSARGKQKFRHLLAALFIWSMMGSPFSWGKARGGIQVEWVGYFLDYGRFEIGISESRAAWLDKWLTEIIEARMVLGRRLLSGLGRLAFSAGALEWTRPFLGPIYAWASRIPGSAVLPVPPMLLLIMSWIRDRLQQGCRTTPCRPAGTAAVEYFRADAKGEAEAVTVGGFVSSEGVPTKQARWFSVRLTPADVPWLFHKGHSSRTIATAELLSSLLCVMLLLPEVEGGSRSCLRLAGKTDNLTNSYVVARLMTTKFPLAPVLMELSCQLELRGIWLSLQWVPRADNQLADDLTNGLFGAFDESLRVKVVWNELRFVLLPRYLQLGLAMYSALPPAGSGLRLAGWNRARRKRSRSISPW
jgi:hypothetical protein